MLLRILRCAFNFCGELDQCELACLLPCLLASDSFAWDASGAVEVSWPLVPGQSSLPAPVATICINACCRPPSERVKKLYHQHDCHCLPHSVQASILSWSRHASIVPIQPGAMHAGRASATRVLRDFDGDVHDLQGDIPSLGGEGWLAASSERRSFRRARCPPMSCARSVGSLELVC